MKYDAKLFNTIRQESKDENGNFIEPSIVINSESEIDFLKAGAYFHTSKYTLDDRLLVSAGVRSDINSFTNNNIVDIIQIK